VKIFRFILLSGAVCVVQPIEYDFTMFSQKMCLP